MPVPRVVWRYFGRKWQVYSVGIVPIRQACWSYRLPRSAPIVTAWDVSVSFLWPVNRSILECVAHYKAWTRNLDHKHRSFVSVYLPFVHPPSIVSSRNRADLYSHHLVFLFYNFEDRTLTSFWIAQGINKLMHSPWTSKERSLIFISTYDQQNRQAKP